MKISDVKIGGVYKTATETPGWRRADFFKVIDICADPAGEPFVRADFTDQGFGQDAKGIYHLREHDIEPHSGVSRQSFADALDAAFPDPDPNSPEWERMGTAGARFAGYLTALKNSNSIRWDEGRQLAEKALVDFLKHIGYDEVAGLYQKTMEKFV